MKIAFFSDVHGNLEALLAMLAHSEDCLARYCGGDCVGYGDSPGEVIDLIRNRAIPCVIGNHDQMVLEKLPVANDREPLYRSAWTRDRLSQTDLDWLAELPIKLDLHVGVRNLTIAHASPWDTTSYLYPDSDTLVRAMPTDGSNLVVGHSHHAFVCPGQEGLIVNCGSVGFPRSGPSGAQYMVLNVETGSWSFRCAPYDIDAVARRMESRGFDPRIIAKLRDPSAK